jgi:hypothetical protein
MSMTLACCAFGPFPASGASTPSPEQAHRPPATWAVMRITGET